MKYKNYMVAAALAATVSSNAWAAIDMDSAVDQTVNIADEQKGTVDANGRVTLDNRAAGGGDGTVLNLTTTLGFTIAAGTSKYIRVNLTDAVFGAAPATSLTTPDVSTPPDTIETASLSQGGGSQDNFVIFELGAPASGSILASAIATMSAETYDVNATGSSSISYALYETAANAVNQTGALVSDTAGFTNIVTASTGDFVTAGTATALVAGGFTTFAANAPQVTGSLAQLGRITAGDILNSSPLKADLAAVLVADLLGVANTVTLTGDVTNGAFNLATNADCLAGAVNFVKVTGNASALSAAINLVVTPNWWVCVDMAAVTTSIEKGSYTVTLGTDALTNTVGSVVYDTTTVDIPYVTTYTGYNQRFFINNTGTTDAFYTATFDTEASVTATAGTAATGTALAGEITTIRANDMVTFTGGSRGAATIEIEAQTGSIDLTTQIIDLDMGTTDTLVLQ
jgi:hypothetical protein